MIDTHSRYANIVLSICAKLEQGRLTWTPPWRGNNLLYHAMRPRGRDGMPFTGEDAITLWNIARARTFTTPFWLTWREADELYGHVDPLARPVRISFPDLAERKPTKDDGTASYQQAGKRKLIPVFNAAQIKGLPERFYARPEPELTFFGVRTPAFEKFIQDTGALISAGIKPGYCKFFDEIEFPPFACFDNARSYDSVLAHELVHWTAHGSRLDRPITSEKAERKTYAQEELIAELGACFLLSDFGQKPEAHDIHAAYIQGWLADLDNHGDAMMQAAIAASQAVSYLHDKVAKNRVTDTPSGRTGRVKPVTTGAPPEGGQAFPARPRQRPPTPL